MQSGYLDTKYIRMNKAGMKGDYFYVMDYDVRWYPCYNCLLVVSNQNDQTEFQNIHKQM